MECGKVDRMAEARELSRCDSGVCSATTRRISGRRFLNYKRRCVAFTVILHYFQWAVKTHSIEERVKELCEKATTVDDAEVPVLFAELHGLLKGAFCSRQVSRSQAIGIDSTKNLPI